MPTHTHAHSVTRPALGRGEHKAAAPRTTSSWAWPVSLGVVYGVYLLFLTSSNGVSDGWAAIQGLVAAVVLAAICYFVGRWQHGRMAEAEAAVYGVVFGVAMGYLLSASGETWLRSTLVGLALGASLAVATFYFVYSRGR
jgi:hypothetical protein